MSTGKQKSPAAPNYTPIAQADQATAQAQLQLGQQQMAQTQKNFNAEWPYAQQYMQQQTAASAASTANAQDQQQFYDSTYKPIETSFANTANNYNSPAQANQRAGQAMGDVSSAFDANRTASLNNLESYGIDPSQTRFSALDLGTRMSQAAASATADTQSRLNTQNEGLALQSQAINTGRGYSSAINNTYNTAANSGSSGFSAANGVANTSTNGMGTAGSIMGGSTNSNSAGANAMNMGYNNNLSGAQFQANQSQQFSQGLGGLTGALGSAALLSNGPVGAALAGMI